MIARDLRKVCSSSIVGGLWGCLKMIHGVGSCWMLEMQKEVQKSANWWRETARWPSNWWQTKHTLTRIWQYFRFMKIWQIQRSAPKSVPYSVRDEQQQHRVKSCEIHIFSISIMYYIPYVYWTVHHCDSWRIKDQLYVTCYFISLLMCSTCFGH